MCIILYKPSGVNLPDKQVLKTCFTNNPDGAGYMYAHKGQVHIRKGFMDFSSFEDSLDNVLKTIDEVKTPMVLHFRITTQGGVNKPCTHPFPLSKNMSDLRQLRYKTDIGIAHNGIITLTSEGYYGYKSYSTKVVDYSDTMKFITDYLSLIIKSPKYYKDKDTLELIERLAGSKLAILDANGHCELIGNFTKDNGIYYSNDSYKPKVYKPVTYTPTTYKRDYSPKRRENDYVIFDEDDYDDDYSWNGYGNYQDYDFYEECYDITTGEYDFEMYGICPIDDFIPDYCEMCSQRNCCKKRMPMDAQNLILDDGVTTLYPTKEFYRDNGHLIGISYDDKEQLYKVYYLETTGNYREEECRHPPLPQKHPHNKLHGRWQRGPRPSRLEKSRKKPCLSDRFSRKKW